jgi:hypothetical protein
LIVRNDDPVGNVRRAAELDWDFYVARLPNAVDRNEWYFRPQVNNAVNMFFLRNVQFPAALMQAPMFDPSADAAVNYGAFGAYAGHELTHAGIGIACVRRDQGFGRVLKNSTAGLFLATTRTRLTQLESTALQWTSLGQILSGAAGTVVVVLDACHSGIAGSEVSATNDDLASLLLTQSNAPVVILASSKGRQRSEEDPREGGGVFTNALVSALSRDRKEENRAGSTLVGLSDLFAAVRRRVIERTGGRQTPWIARNALLGEMTLF